MFFDTHLLLSEIEIEEALRREIVGIEVGGVTVLGAWISTPSYLDDGYVFLVELVLSAPPDGGNVWPAFATRRLRELTYEALSRTDIGEFVDVETAGRPADFDGGVSVL